MCSDIAIEFKNVFKDYTLYQKPTDVVYDFIGKKSKLKSFKALKDVSFTVKKGEIVGLIGRNGAGKSTLLKILAGVLPQTSGTVNVQGKVSAILELGTGFHPEYTGRENVIMGGMCLGLSKTEVEKRMDDIIDFSELGEHIDRPFKTYSSGMKARLTFSTAISIVPEVLIIDEALSVGDALFAEKCFDKIKSFAKNGTTIFFVSHSLSHVYELCNSAMLMHKGEILYAGDPKNVGEKYELLLHDERNSLTIVDTNSVDVSSVKLLESKVTDSAGRIVNNLVNGNSYYISICFKVEKRLVGANVGFRFRKLSGQVIYGVSIEQVDKIVDLDPGVYEAIFTFNCTLNNSQIILGVSIGQGSGKRFSLIERINEAGIYFVSSKSEFQGEFDMKSSVKLKKRVEAYK